MQANGRGEPEMVTSGACWNQGEPRAGTSQGAFELHPSLSARWGPTGGHDAIPTATGGDASELVGDGPDGDMSGGGDGGDALCAGA